MLTIKELNKAERDCLDIIQVCSARIEQCEIHLDSIFYQAKQFLEGEFLESDRPRIMRELKSLTKKANKYMGMRDKALSELKVLDFLKNINRKTIDKR